MSEFDRYQHVQRTVSSLKRPDNSASEYVNAGPNEDQNRRVVSALNGIFTSLTHSFQAEIESPESDSLPFPSTLLGRRSSIKIYNPKSQEPFRSQNHHLLQQFDSYYELEYHNVTSSIFRIPVGFYGERVARTFIQTQQVLLSLLAEKMRDECSLEDIRNQEFIKDETFHGNTLRTLQEGIQSEGASLALLTGSAVEGYENDFIGLLKEIEKKDIVRKLSAISPLGVIVPSTLRGYGFVKPLEHTESGLVLSPDIMHMMSEEKKVEPYPPRPAERKRGCPASYRNTPLTLSSGEEIIVAEAAVTTMTRIFVAYFEKIYSGRSWR